MIQGNTKIIRIIIKYKKKQTSDSMLVCLVLLFPFFFIVFKKILKMLSNILLMKPIPMEHKVWIMTLSKAFKKKKGKLLQRRYKSWKADASNTSVRTKQFHHNMDNLNKLNKYEIWSLLPLITPYNVFTFNSKELLCLK